MVDADAEDLRARRRGRQRPADGGLHHDGELADRGAHQRSRVPRRRHRRSADRRLGQRLRGGGLPGASGKVALVQRGTCPFVQKWALAQAAGATGVIIYNEGNTPTRQNPIFVDNQPDPPATIAAVISSYTLGNELLQAYKQGKNPTVDFKVYGTFTDRFLPQVIAETQGRRPEPRRRRRRAPRLGAGRARASTTTAPAPRRCLPRPRRSPTATTTCARRSASPGGARRRTGLSARPTTRTT